MSETFAISYRFAFAAGEVITCTVELDRTALNLATAPTGPRPDWTALGCHQCGNCPFVPETTPYCPIAVNLADIVEQFNHRFSYQQVEVTVTTENRDYFKATTLQEGLSSLLGIIMVTSGCPPMERLKPLVRFHLPFATLEETTFRTISLHLLTQHLLQKHGRPADFSLAGVERIYAEVATVNNGFARRLLQAAQKDANINALVNLACFAEMVPFSAEEMLESIEGNFAGPFPPV